MNEKKSILIQQTIKILKQIEYIFDTRKYSPSDLQKNKKIEITFGDINFSIFNKTEDFYNVAQFLKEKGINFVVTFDLVNDSPITHVNKKIMTEQNVILGYINDKDLSIIWKKVSKLKDKLTESSANVTKHINIFLDTNRDSLVINLVSISVPKETIERSMLDILIDRNTETSWDEIIHEDDKYDKSENKAKQKKVSDAGRRLNSKVINKTDLKEKLIKQRKNNYSLTRKVTKK